MKTKEERHNEIYQSPRLLRVSLKPNSQSGQQDQPDQEARKSSDHQSASGSYGETRCGNVDCRIPGIPHSTVQQQDANRKETVKKLIQQFENHPNKESFLHDLNKTEKMKTFSEESKKLITDLGNTEISELCESCSKKQCPDCNLYWEIGIVYCSCGRCLTPSQSTKKLEKKNFDALSIPGYVIKKNLHRGAKHGASERQRMYYKASMVGTKPSWKDDTTMRNTASLCQKFGGLKSRFFSVTKTCTGRSLLYCNKGGKNSKLEKLGTQDDKRRCSRTNESTTGFV